MSRIAAAAALAVAPFAAQAADYQIDTAHTTAGFKVRHMMVSTVRGEFGAVTGSFKFDEKNPGTISFSASVDTTTINTREPKRDEHLRSADFFDAAKFPKLTLKSKKVEAGTGGALKVTADLTMHGVTKEIVLSMEPVRSGKNPWGQSVAGTTATAKINRKDWGLVWNKALETGGLLVSEEVELVLDVEGSPVPTTN